MSNYKPDIDDIASVLVHIHGPADEAVYNTAKFSYDQNKELLEKLYQYGSKYEFSSSDKEMVLDALRIFLEGVSEGDVVAVTGESKEHFLKSYAELIREWNMTMPKLKRQSYDSPEYQEIATRSGLFQDLI